MQCCSSGSLLSGKRQFFGQFGTPDSKVYKERRLIGYSPEQLYEVVSCVQHYQQFVPWCVGSHVLQRRPDGSYLEAELQIGFQMISERYISKVKLQPPHLVSSTVADSALFHHLESVWQMTPGPRPNTTWLSFSVDFAFLNPLYANVAHLFFQEVVTRMMGAFEGRCRHLFGPPSFTAGAAGSRQGAQHASHHHQPHHQQHHQQHVHGGNQQQHQKQQHLPAQQEQVQQLSHVPPVAAAAAGKAGVVAVQSGKLDESK